MPEPLSVTPAEMTAGLSKEGIDFASFFDANLNKARRLAWRLVGGDQAAAEDVVQEAFLKAYRGLGGFRADARLDTWFFRIVVNEANTYHRRQRLRRMLRLAPADEIGPAPRPAHGDPVLRERIAEAIAELSHGQRQAFVLVHLERYTVREAAELAGKSVGSIKKHLNRALQRLREQLAGVRVEPEQGRVQPSGEKTR